MDIERLKELKKRVKQSANQDGTRLPKREMMNDLLALIDEAIARQSVKNEPVAISKTETTSCEWCCRASNHQRIMDELQSTNVYCPNCGRKLKGE